MESNFPLQLAPINGQNWCGCMPRLLPLDGWADEMNRHAKGTIAAAYHLEQVTESTSKYQAELELSKCVKFVLRKQRVQCELVRSNELETAQPLARGQMVRRIKLL